MAFRGLGELAEIAYLGVQEWGLELVEVFDTARTDRSFFGCPVRPVDEVAEADAERIIVTTFHPKNPMRPQFLPEQVHADPRMVWIFAELAGTVKRGEEIDQEGTPSPTDSTTRDEHESTLD